MYCALRYGTALGLANEAAAHNDALMPLDEIGRGADPVEVYKSAYALLMVRVSCRERRREGTVI